MIDVEFTLKSKDEMVTLACVVASLAKVGDVIHLKGNLGTGKTFFARAFIQSLVGRPIDVPSPTFTLVQTYFESTLPIWHFDLYRLKDPHEVLELGFEEALATGVTLIEWPERLGALDYPCNLVLNFRRVNGGSFRHVSLSASEEWIEALEEVIAS